jgi:hypothetical protein
MPRYVTKEEFYALAYGAGIKVLSNPPVGSANNILKAAIAEVGAGGVLYLGPGLWRTSGGLTIAVDNLRIIGAGRFQTFLY